MNLFLEAINRPADAFKRRYSKLSWVFVIAAIIIVTVFDAVLSYILGHPDRQILMDIMKTIGGLFMAGILTYLLVCIAFWLICKALGSKTGLPCYIHTWGISYIPTVICAIIVIITENFFYVFWNNTVWGMLISVLLVGILIWKIILYLIFLHEVAGLRGNRMVIAFILCGLVILMLAAANGYLGLKSPIL
ncbi:MAG: YIP1 family protein [Acetivibrionales bacterium]|jgi:hypothetical protein